MAGAYRPGHKNKEVNTAIMKAYESGDFSKMGDYIATDAIDHGEIMAMSKGWIPL